MTTTLARPERLVPYKRAMTIELYRLIDICKEVPSYVTNSNPIDDAARAYIRAANRYKRMHALMVAGAEIPEWTPESLRDVQDASEPSADALADVTRTLRDAVRGAMRILNVRADE